METGVSSLTVLFEDPFWVGVFERRRGGVLEVCKVTFGAEPRDFEVYELIEKQFSHLRFSPPVKCVEAEEKRLNPKRTQREIRKRLDASGIGTKAQQALSLQRELGAVERKAVSKEQREAEKQRQFELKSEKRKEKHRGH